MSNSTITSDVDCLIPFINSTSLGQKWRTKGAWRYDLCTCELNQDVFACELCNWTMLNVGILWIWTCNFLFGHRTPFPLYSLCYCYYLLEFPCCGTRQHTHNHTHAHSNYYTKSFSAKHFTHCPDWICTVSV